MSMTRVRRHVFVAAGVTDWSGRQVACRDCPLPRDNEIHEVPDVPADVQALERRRLGERE